MAVLSSQEIDSGLLSLPGWAAGEGAIAKQFVLDGGFVGAVMFVNRVTGAAEAANHHPDIAIAWNKVTVTLATHSEGGVTAKDMALAGRIDELAG